MSKIYLIAKEYLLKVSILLQIILESMNDLYFLFFQIQFVPDTFN